MAEAGDSTAAPPKAAQAAKSAASQRDRMQQMMRTELDRFLKENLMPELQALLEESSRHVLSELSSRKLKSRSQHGETVYSPISQSLAEPGGEGNSETRSYIDGVDSTSLTAPLFARTTSESQNVGHNPRIVAGFSVGPGEDESESEAEERMVLEQSRESSSVCVDLLQNPAFSYAMAGLVLLNALFMGVEADFAARTLEPSNSSGLFHAIGLFFCVVFVSEIAMRIYVYGTEYFCGRDWRWNMFDFVIVGLQAIELLTPAVLAYTHDVHLTFLRVFRVLRTLRLLRVGRIVNATAELRMLVLTIFGSWRSLMWILLILVATTYSFSVLVTQVVADYWISMPEKLPDAQMQHMYGSLIDTMLVLYMILTNGMDWSEALEPLRTVSAWMALAFCVYVFITVFAVLNVVTGLFLNAAQKTAEDDKRRVMVDQMRHAFVVADKDGSGEVSKEEFEEQLECKDFLLYLKGIDLNQDNARDLFALLDGDGSGEINISEFVNGAVRLHGPAKAIDFAVFLDRFWAWSERIEHQLSSLDQAIAEIRDNDTILIEETPSFRA